MNNLIKQFTYLDADLIARSINIKKYFDLVALLFITYADDIAQKMINKKHYLYRALKFQAINSV